MVLGLSRILGRKTVAQESAPAVTAPVAKPATADTLAPTKSGPSADVASIKVSAADLQKDRVATLMAMFNDIAAQVPYVVPKMVPGRGGRPEIAFHDRSNEPPRAPYEDKRFRYDLIADRTISYAEALKSRISEHEDSDAPQLDIKVGREGAGGDKAFFLLASTSRAQLWASTLGKGLAHFAMERYGRYANHPQEGRPKLTHAAQVTWHTSMIADNHDKRGIKLDAAWRDRLEYAGFLHDVGYYNGGFAHPGKGGLDMLFNLQSHLKSIGSDLSQDEVERIALMVECHGMSYPWDQKIDPRPRVAGVDAADRFSGYHYVSADVVWNILKPNWRKLAEVLRQENKAYLAVNPQGLKWLDDEQEVKNLVLGGWMLHCGDKFLGEDSLPSPKGLPRPSRGVYAQNVPITSEVELDKFHRDNSLDAALRSAVAPNIDGWVKSKEKPAWGDPRRFTAREKEQLAALDEVIAGLHDRLLALRSQIEAGSAQQLSSDVLSLAARCRASLTGRAESVDARLLGEICHQGPGTPPPVSGSQFAAAVMDNLQQLAAMVAAHPDIRIGK